MELRTSNRSLEAVSLEDFGRDVARRRDQAGAVAMPRNSGQRRTPGKLSLLAALKAFGARW